MAGAIETKMNELGIELPAAATPAGNYVPFVISGNHVYISGQITARDGKIEFIGKLGSDYSVEEGQQAARICGLNILSQLKAAVGDLDKVKRCVRLGGFVNSIPEFTDQPKVINGASDLMVEVFGDAGRHARAAVSCPSLPLGVAVEVDAVFEIG